MKLKGFFAGLAGGAVAAAAVVLLLVFVFDLGDVNKTVVQATPQTPTSYSTPSTTASGSGLTPQQIYSNLSGGVVMVLSDFGSSGTDVFGQSQSSQALGTGFVVDKQGYILTNAHVVDESGQRASSVTVVFNKGGSETTRVTGQLVGVDVGSDVAVIKVDPSKVGNLNPLPLGNSDQVQVGEPVVAIGNPLGYDFSITSGIVSAIGRSLQAPNGQTIPNGIQTDAAINQGNSGGPLIDSSGKVIGINEQIASSGGGNDGLGFAVPINTAVRSMGQLKANGKVTYAWMGVGVQTLTSDVASTFNVKTQGGALVESVSAGSPAAKAGIKGGNRQVTVQGQQFTIGGDVIVKIDDTPIKTADDLIAYLGTKKPGDTVTVTVERNGQTQQIQVTLAQRPSNL
ncbi:MAG TPA: trypsin-like peptidase domain-containing protein [Thermoleophilia bacterium]|nr:trypsin-like peptidase domain-containing protein [Thermoleophilia bacterium]